MFGVERIVGRKERGGWNLEEGKESFPCVERKSGVAKACMRVHSFCPFKAGPIERSKENR